MRDSARGSILWPLVGLLVLISGCAHNIKPSTQDELLDIAVRDLACQPASLTLARLSIDGTLQEAQGCDKSAVYVLEDDQWRRKEPPRHDIRAWAAGRHEKERCRTTQPYDGALEQKSAPTDCADPSD